MRVDITFETETEVKFSYRGYNVYMKKLTKGPGWYYIIKDKYNNFTDLGTLYLTKICTITKIQNIIDISF